MLNVILSSDKNANGTSWHVTDGFFFSLSYITAAHGNQCRGQTRIMHIRSVPFAFVTIEEIFLTVDLEKNNVKDRGTRVQH